MTRRHYLAVVAGSATLLAAFPLSSVFSQFSWFFYTFIAVILIVGTAMLVRTLRGPVWAQVLAMMAALLLYLTWAFPSGGELGRLIPTGHTFAHFNTLLTQAGQQVRDQAVPVPDFEGLLLLTTAGIGLVAILVDLFAVGLRRPALAGLPMLAIYSVPVAVLPHGVSPFTFIFAAAGFLWLLVSDSVDRVRRFGRRFTGEGRDVDVWEPSPLSAAGRRLGVVSLVVAILIPLAVPGMTSSLLQRLGTGAGSGDGPGNGLSTGAQVDLKALLHDNLIRNDAFEMVRVRTNDPTPYYLRLGIADQPTKDGFLSVLPSVGTTLSRPLPDFSVPSATGVSGTRYHADIEVVNLDQKLAPMYQQVVSTTGLDKSNWFYDQSTNQVFAKRVTVNHAQYSLDYVRVNYTPQALRTAATIAANDLGAHNLSTVPPVDQITEKVKELTDGKTTEYDKVRALYDYLGPDNGFTYSLTTDPPVTGNAIVDFLTSKKGFCTQYAAALAWLVRVAGYPARVAFGFTRGSGARNGTTVLTNYNLHAWTEVFFPDFGWVPFDATPASSIVGSVQPAWAPGAGQTDNGQDQQTPDTGQSASPGPSGAVPNKEDRLPGDENPVPSVTTPTSPIWYIGAAVATLVILVLLIPAYLRRSLRRSRRTRSGQTIEIGPSTPALPAHELITDPAAVVPARRDAHAAWAELLDTMVDFGIPVDNAETPRATAERIGQLPSVSRDAADKAALLARAEERARYARAPLRTDQLDAAIRGTRSALASRASRWQRLSAALLPRSVLLRWRLGWINFATRSSRVTGRLRDSLYALSPRRLLTRSS
jgi:transglutaminase-like putative cysteine protease